MKNIYKYTGLLLISLFFTTSCDEGFDELNVSPTAVTRLDPMTVLNQAILSCVPRANVLPLEMAFVQQVVTPNSGVIAGGNFNQINVTLTNANWNNGYLELIKHATDVINTLEGNTDRSNLYNMARIIKAYGAMIITDTHGDIPYFEAGKGFLGNITFPVYDPQRAIYLDVIKEFQEASAGLNSGGSVESTDILFGGDVNRWKRLGNSLLLRAAMRVSNREPEIAKAAIAAAISGGLIESNDNNFVIRHDNNYQNLISQPLTSNESSNYYMTGNFVDHLKNTNDPRLTAMAVRYKGSGSGTDQNNAIAGNAPNITITSKPEDQFGLPMGYENTTAAIWASENGFASFYDLTQLDRTRMAKLTAPSYMVTYAQTQLLLAEAIVRGYANGDANSVFKTAIAANMDVISNEYENTTLNASDVDSYIAANSLVSGTELEQINTEYWISSFLNGPEAWANFRRTGFPMLTPNPFPAKDIQGDFVNRLPYPVAELSANATNLQAAISSQGFNGNDDMDSKVWWAK